MEHYFAHRGNEVFNRNNDASINTTFNRFIDELKGEIEAWCQMGSGWVIEGIVAANDNIARYEPFCGESYMPLPNKVINKKAIINIQNRDDQCFRWAIRAVLYPAPEGKNPIRTSSYPTQDGLNFEGIDFPTPVSQIDKLTTSPFTGQRHRSQDQRKRRLYYKNKIDDTQQCQNTHYTYVKGLTALLYDQSKNSNNKHLCERCLQGYLRIDLLERRKPECQGQLKSPTRTEMPKEGENMVSFTNFHKQIKAPIVIYADFESVVRKLPSCEPSQDKNFTVKTDKHEACGFTYIIVRSDGATTDPRFYRGEARSTSFWLKC